MDVAVIRYLRGRAHRVATARELGLAAEGDDPLIQCALAGGLVVLTFDSDFRRNAFRAGCQCLWIRGPESTARERIKLGYDAVKVLLESGQPLVRIQKSGAIQADPGRVDRPRKREAKRRKAVRRR